MNTVKAQINGLEELVRRLHTDLRQPLRATSLAVAAEIENRLVPYPAATMANSPDNPKGRWYERGYGARWKTRSGVGGRKTSQTMNRRWNIRQSGDEVVLENLADYSAYVYHDPGAPLPHQAWFHAQHGWKNDKDVIQSVIDDGTVREIATEQITRLIGTGN